MSKISSVFSSYYDIQESWIQRQINNLKYDSFIDLSIAKQEIEDAGLVAFIDNKSIEQFREKHLSKIGKERLSSTLRTYKKRENRRLTTKRLDLNISRSAYIALESLVDESGLTKTQFIEHLILKERESKV